MQIPELRPGRIIRLVEVVDAVVGFDIEHVGVTLVVANGVGDADAGTEFNEFQAGEKADSPRMCSAGRRVYTLASYARTIGAEADDQAIGGVAHRSFRRGTAHRLQRSPGLRCPSYAAAHLRNTQRKKGEEKKEED